MRLLLALLLLSGCHSRAARQTQRCLEHASTPQREAPEIAKRACSEVCGNAHGAFDRGDERRACQILNRWERARKADR